jgi:lipopolysaccharide/colanic/teichoic acid biosynthesis glycosyltransferase
MDLSRAPSRQSGQALPDVRTNITARISGEIRAARTSGAAVRAIVGLAPAESVRPRTSSAQAAARAAQAPRSRSEIANRVANIVIASVALILLIPVFLIIAIIVKVTSPGPILYTQTRVGIDRRSRRALALYDRRARDVGGLVFTIYKFRSMYIDAERHCGEVWATKNDPRVTPVGRFLRKSRIDELPQLWNVLKGDMSLVGPRPALPEEVEQYQRWQRRRLRMRPGLTCLWAVNGRDSVDFETWMKLDMQYIDNWSLALDWKIILKTIPQLLSGKGAT